MNFKFLSYGMILVILALRKGFSDYRVMATLEGLIGRKTANGHVIVKHDWFVALPSVKILSKNFSWDLRIRITRGNRSAIVPVWDVGPWNELDNYWDINRNTWGVDKHSLVNGFPNFGVPMSQVSYTHNWHYGYTVSKSGYINKKWERIPYDPISGNPGTQEKIKNPSGIDLADGVYYLGLQLRGNSLVNWNFTTELPRVERIIIQQGSKTIYDSQTGISHPAREGVLTFKIIFSETMETQNFPVLSFGKTSPYNQNVVRNGFWSQTRYENDTWIGTTNIGASSDEGQYTISITAQDCGRNQIDRDGNIANGYQPGKDIRHSFVVKSSELTSNWQGRVRVEFEETRYSVTWSFSGGEVTYLKHTSDRTDVLIKLGLVADGDNFNGVARISGKREHRHYQEGCADDCDDTDYEKTYPEVSALTEWLYEKGNNYRIIFRGLTDECLSKEIGRDIVIPIKEKDSGKIVLSLSEEKDEKMSRTIRKISGEIIRQQ